MPGSDGHADSEGDASIGGGIDMVDGFRGQITPTKDRLNGILGGLLSSCPSLGGSAENVSKGIDRSNDRGVSSHGV